MKDLIILGNGMAGMTAALYAKRANLDFEIIGKGEYDFGQIGDAILVENYPCASSVSGFELAEKLHDQLADNGVNIIEDEIASIGRFEKTYFIYGKNQTYKAKSIIYALGAKHRELPESVTGDLPVHYCALCDGPLYEGKKVAVIGGGDVAFTQAEYLSKICSRVYIIMCDSNVTAAPSTFERVSKIKNVEIMYGCPVKKIHRDSDGIYWIMCENLRGPIFAAGIFVAIGMIPNIAPVSHFDLLRDQNGYIVADETGKTPYFGLFAAGDVRQKKVRQSITAAADGANAVQSVIDYLKG